VRGDRDDRVQGMRSSRHRRRLTEPDGGVSQRSSKHPLLLPRRSRGSDRSYGAEAVDEGRFRKWRISGLSRGVLQVLLRYGHGCVAA
jgi:hypothetical protein